MLRRMVKIGFHLFRLRSEKMAEKGKQLDLIFLEITPLQELE